MGTSSGASMPRRTRPPWTDTTVTMIPSPTYNFSPGFLVRTDITPSLQQSPEPGWWRAMHVACRGTGPANLRQDGAGEGLPRCAISDRAEAAETGSAHRDQISDSPVACERNTFT